jgi:hypothetical protein
VKTQYGKVLRAFHFEGKVHKVGEVHEYPEAIAVVLKTANKLDYCPEPIKPEPIKSAPKVEEKKTEPKPAVEPKAKAAASAK